MEVCERAAANGSPDGAAVAVGLRAILSGERDRFELEYPCDSPTERRWFLLSAAAAPVEEGAGIVLFHVDISDRKALEERLAVQVEIDDLTGLPNRRVAVRTLQQALDTGGAPASPVTVMFLDLNDFTSVNDDHGHAAGDRLLSKVAARIRRAVRDDDLLCRLGGDEFVLICRSRHRADADALATRLRSVMAEPFQFDATEVTTGIAIGIATSDADSTVDGLLHEADAAMYVDKRRSRAPRTRRPARRARRPPTPPGAGPLPETPGLLAEFKASRAMADAIVAHSNDLVMLFESDGTIAWASPAADTVFGFDPDELVGMNGLALIHPDDQERVFRAFASIPDMGDHVLCEFRIVRPDESIVWVEETATNLLDQPDVGMIVGNLRDVTARREAESAASFRSTLLAAAGQAIVARDMDDVVTYWNRAAETTYGWLADEAIGVELGTLFPAVDGWEPTSEAILEQVRLGDPWSGETVVHTKDGSALAVMLTDTPVFDESGVHVGTIGISTDITEKRRNAEVVARLSAIVEGSHDAIVSHDLYGVIDTWNGGATRLFGYEEVEMIGRHIGDLVAPGNEPALMQMLHNVSAGDASNRLQTVGRRSDGSTFHIVLLLSPVKDAVGRLVGASTIARDISEAVVLRQRTEDDRRRLADAQASARLGSWELDKSTGVVTRSDELWRILGLEPGSISGVDFDHIHPDDRELVEATLETAMHESTFLELTHRIVRPDGSVRWVVSRTSRFGSTSGDILAGTMLDVTEQHEAEMALAHQATHDTLTGLPNRARLDERLRSALSAPPAGAAPRIAVAIVDLDQFKTLNDTYGHSFGDAVLRAAADRLASELPTDEVYRLGGDEFVVVRDGVDTDSGASDFGADIRRALSRPLAVRDRRIDLTASVGVTRSTAIDTVESLLRDADTAMYQAKADGPSGVVAFDERGRERAHRRTFLEAELRLALERDQLHVVYQPVIDLGSLRVAGFEALLRWEHPDFGAVGPDEFIPIAEATGLILPIGDWVLQRSLEQLAAWTDALPSVVPALWVAVNLSARQLGDVGLVDRVAETIERTGLSPERVHLEITETVFVDRVANAVATIDALHALGTRISMDDFGTGYSSLSYLHRLPINTLKVDRCFVQRVTSRSDNSIVRAIEALAESLDLDVVAEGIETTEQLEIIRAMGCGYGQGFLWSRPLPAELAISWAMANAPWVSADSTM